MGTLHVTLFVREQHRGQATVQRLFKSPAVREHGQERRYREKPHAAVETGRSPTFFTFLFILSRTRRRAHREFVVGSQHFAEHRRV